MVIQLAKENIQLNLDKNSSSHVSCGVIGFDCRCIGETVRDWIKPTVFVFMDSSKISLDRPYLILKAVYSVV